MNLPATTTATYKDLYSVPDNMVGEIVAGDLITQPRPGPLHSRAAAVLGAKILSSYDFKLTGDENGWWILDEPEIHLTTDVVVPDVAGWKKSTMQELPDTAWFGIAPDWVCEVISPSTAKYDRGIKREIYAREGIGHYWIVDPIEKIIEVFVLEHGKWFLAMTVCDEQIVPLPPFLELPFDLSQLWP